MSSSRAGRARCDCNCTGRFRSPRLDSGGRVGVVLIERLVLEQRLGESVELVAVLGEDAGDIVVRCGDELAPLLVDQPLGLLRHLVRVRQSVLREHGDGPDRGVHPPSTDHLASDLCELLDVRLRAGGDIAEDNLFRRSSSQRDVDPRLGRSTELTPRPASPARPAAARTR